MTQRRSLSLAFSSFQSSASITSTKSIWLDQIVNHADRAMNILSKIYGQILKFLPAMPLFLLSIYHENDTFWRVIPFAANFDLLSVITEHAGYLADALLPYRRNQKFPCAVKLELLRIKLPVFISGCCDPDNPDQHIFLQAQPRHDNLKAYKFIFQLKSVHI